MVKTVLPSRLRGALCAMPGKSASHRALLMAALCPGATRVAPLQRSQDVEATLSCARALGLLRGAQTEPLPDASGHFAARLTGGGAYAGGETRALDCGESGSTLRFLLPLALDGRGPVRFTGHGRLMSRPLDVYERLFVPRGVRWEAEGDSLTVEGRLQSGEYALPGDVSSQFLTGLLFALPRLDGESVLRVTTPLQSRAYVDLTRRAQAAFGVVSFWEEDGQVLRIPGGQVPASPGEIHVEGDWSHAAFFLVAGALGGGVRVRGLDPDSAQGDRSIVPILQGMGADVRWEDGAICAYPSALRAAEVDASQIPDLVPVLAVAMAAARGVSRITGAERLRIKESDRLSAMRAALCAAGADARETPDGLVISGGHPLRAAAIDGCNDHRVVMAMAVASALADGPLTISDAEAVRKSAPAFWDEFAALGGDAR